MNDAGDDEIDASDWLAGQFDATGQVPQQPEPEKPAPLVQQQPVQPAAPQTYQPFGQQPPAAEPPAAQAPVAQPPAAQPPLADPPSPNTQGGFNWGLRPGGTEDAVPPQSPTAPPAQQPPSQQPPAQQLPSQQLPPQAPVYQAPPPEAFPPQYQAPTTPYVPPVYEAQPPTEAYTPPPPFQTSPPEPAPLIPPAEPAPTAPFSWEDFAATQAPVQPQQPSPVQPLYPGESQPTEAYTVQPWEPAQPASTIPARLPPDAQYPIDGQYPPSAEESHDPTSAIDALFGEQQFQEYEEVGVLKTIQTAPGGDPAEKREVLPREPLTRQQRILMIIAGGLVALLALVALFFLGTKLGSAQAAPAPASTSGAPSAAPTSAATGGTAAAGVQQWTALQGGECIQPWTTAGVWAQTFTVVSCTADHQAEMVFKGTLPDPEGAAYPTGAQFATEITPLCSAPTAINYATASAVTDLQVSFSYPANASAWQGGARTYYCFVSRTSSGNLPGDLSVKTTQ